MLSRYAEPHQPLARWRSRLQSVIQPAAGAARRGVAAHRRPAVCREAEGVPPAPRGDVGRHGGEPLVPQCKLLTHLGDDGRPFAGCGLPEQAHAPDTMGSSRARASSASPAETAATARPAGRARPRHGRPRCRRKSRRSASASTAAVSVKSASSAPRWAMRGSRASISASAGRSSCWMLTKRTSSASSSGSSCDNDSERLRSLTWVARPDQASATYGAGTPSRRDRHFADQRLRRVQIRNVRRNLGEFGLAGERQAGQRAMQVERRQRLAARRRSRRRLRGRPAAL